VCVGDGGGGKGRRRRKGQQALKKYEIEHRHVAQAGVLMMEEIRRSEQKQELERLWKVSIDEEERVGDWIVCFVAFEGKGEGC